MKKLNKKEEKQLDSLDSDSIGEALVLDNHEDFSHNEGNLIKNFEDENQKYM